MKPLPIFTISLNSQTIQPLTNMPQKANAPHRPWTTKPLDRNAPSQGRHFVTGFYKSSEWRRIRIAHLTSNPLCVECHKQGIINPGNVVDHIKRLNQRDPFDTQHGRFGEALDMQNLQTLCSKHHNEKSAKERHGKI
jgi:5-methylcytosine-specific restriction endonuclease McrA